jgi:hypothetical protein
MCGAISSGALFLFDPRPGRQGLATLLLLQAGRIATYTAAGGIVASIASLAVDPSTTALGYRVLQFAGAAVLMWLGFATAGLLPKFALPGSTTISVSTFAERAIAPLRRHKTVGPMAVGLTWGLTPCPMVYAALFTAAVSGSFLNGALWMLAFGFGTLPGVIGATLGVSALTRIKRSPAADVVSGVLIAGFGFSTLYFGWPASAIMCMTPQ